MDTVGHRSPPVGRIALQPDRPLARYVAAIQTQRGDYNGKVLTIRREDLRSLAIRYDTKAEDLMTTRLHDWEILTEGTQLDWATAGAARPAEVHAP